MSQSARRSQPLPPAITLQELMTQPLQLGEIQRSRAELFLAKRYKSALEGDRAAIREMLKIVRANVAAGGAIMASSSDEGDPLAPQLTADELRRQRAREREACKADPALLLLGIAVIDDGGLGGLGRPGDPGYRGRLLRLRPTHLSPWVVELADARAGGAVPPDLAVAAVLAEDDPRLSQWRDRGHELTAQIVAARAPGATRFQRGSSPNPRGRRRGAKLVAPAADLPFGGFLSELVNVPIGGELYRMSRVEALISKLMADGLNGDEQLQAVFGSEVADLVLASWKARLVTAILEGGAQEKRSCLRDSLVALGLASSRARRRLLLAPPLIQAALARLRNRRFDRNEQDTVMRLVADPPAIEWPRWWTA